jgi:CO/xanthine dehydrogenase Mo-binding subunit
MEVAVDRTTGTIRLVRAVAANDSGQIINPTGIKMQIEGGIIQSSSWTLKEEVIYDRTRIQSSDWTTYPILTFPEVPEVTVELIDRPGQPFLGTGEASQGPTGAAIANAVASATGLRMRDLPLTPEKIKRALAKA